MATRRVVQIDEELCNGCGACVIPCVEGAIVLEDGKARVKDEALCDGAGFCIPICPTGALSVDERQAPDFDERLAEEQVLKRGSAYIAQCCHRCGASEVEAALLPLRHQGQSLWVCASCLPALIHG